MFNTRRTEAVGDLTRLTWYIETSDERVASITRLASTDCSVIDRLAPRARAAGSRTRIAALFIDTSHVRGALSAHRALWPAGRWAAHEVWQARAH